MMRSISINTLFGQDKVQQNRCSATFIFYFLKLILRPQHMNIDQKLSNILKNSFF